MNTHDGTPDGPITSEPILRSAERHFDTEPLRPAADQVVEGAHEIGRAIAHGYADAHGNDGGVPRHIVERTADVAADSVRRAIVDSAMDERRKGPAQE